MFGTSFESLLMGCNKKSSNLAFDIISMKQMLKQHTEIIFHIILKYATNVHGLHDMHWFYLFFYKEIIILPNFQNAEKIRRNEKLQK